MAEHDDAPAGELTEGSAIAVLDAKDDDANQPAEPETAEATDVDENGDKPAKPTSVRKIAAVIGLAVAVSLAGVAGWMSMRTHRLIQAADRQSQIIQTARQGALNLTTIDWQHADADVQRILDSSTGEFYDDFAKRSAPFIKVVKEAKSTSTGSITDAGLESESGDAAQVLVAVAVKTSNAGGQDQEPREWRMRVSVQNVGDVMKVSNVEFVP